MKNIVFLIVLLFVTGCSDTNTDNPIAINSSTPNLVLFVNPQGQPCKMQASIVQEMADELKEKVIVRYIRTDIKEDQKTFYKYGIRGLPTVLLTDAAGEEIARLTPGVHPQGSIRKLLKSIPRG